MASLIVIASAFSSNKNVFLQDLIQMTISSNINKDKLSITVQMYTHMYIYKYIKYKIWPPRFFKFPKNKGKNFQEWS